MKNQLKNQLKNQFCCSRISWRIISLWYRFQRKEEPWLYSFWRTAQNHKRAAAQRRTASFCCSKEEAAQNGLFRRNTQKRRRTPKRRTALRCYIVVIYIILVWLFLKRTFLRWCSSGSFLIFFSKDGVFQKNLKRRTAAFCCFSRCFAFALKERTYITTIWFFHWYILEQQNWFFNVEGLYRCDIVVISLWYRCVSKKNPSSENNRSSLLYRCYIYRCYIS